MLEGALEISQPNLLLKKFPTAGSTGKCPGGSCIPPEKETPQPLGSPFQCSISHKVNYFLMFIWNILYSNFCSLPLVLSLGTTKKKPGPILLPPTLQIFVSIDKISLSLIFFRLHSLRALNLSSYRRCSRRFIILLALHWTHSRSSLSFWN